VRELQDIDVVARYWAQRYARTLRDDKTAAPLVAIVGHEMDAIGTADIGKPSMIEELAWLTGYLTYPCDGVYVTAVFDPQPDTVLCWTHLIATNETRVLAIVLDRDEQRFIPVDVSEDYDEDFFEPLHRAAHDFDKFAPEPGEDLDRKVARDEVIRNDGIGYMARLFDPSYTMNAARNTIGRKP